MTLSGNDSYAVSLLHMDGADQSVLFPEDPYINCKFPDIPILNFRKLNCGINDTDNEAIALGGGGAWDASVIMQPCILQVGSTIYLYYAAKNASGVYAIGLATVAVAGFTGKGFSKSGNNPILQKGSAGAWDETGVDYPFVIYDADAGLWKMWYVGWNGAGTYAIGYATSSNPDSGWNKYGSTPILSPDVAWEGSILMSPCVLRESATSYKMLYSGNNPSPPGAQIGLATSSDGIAFTKYGSNPVIAKGAASSWNKYSSHGPRSLKKDPARGIYELLFCGKPNDASKYSSIGYAYSTDLITWTQGANPTLVVTKTWESHEVENPSVLLLNYINYVYYDTWYGSPSTIGLAIFGSPAHTWTAHGAAKIITADSKFGGACASFPGAAGDWIDMPDTEDVSFGDKPFAIDYFIKRGATGAIYRIFGQNDSAGSVASFAAAAYFGADNKLNSLVGVGGFLKTATSTGTITDTNTWHHIAMFRIGDTLYQAIDGTVDGSVALGAGAIIQNSTNKFSIGRNGEYTLNTFNGKIDEFRISNGIARGTTTTFPVPSAAYGMDFPLAVDNLAHSHVLGTVALIQGYLLTVASLTHASAIDNVALVGLITLIVNSLNHANTLDGITLSQSDIQQLLVELGVVARLRIMDSLAPIVKGRNPRVGETAVPLDAPISFYICSGVSGEDGVDITQVIVVVDGVSYALGDQTFVYSGSPDQYLIQVNHPDFEYEQRVDVEINARSLCGEAMAPVSYSFSTEWEATKDRGKEGRIEIYLAADYSFSVLTLQEDWYRQGQERQSLDLELWYGRYQKLPFIEEMEMRLIAGNTNALGKEVLDNSWLSVKVEDGEWEPIGSDTVILFGPMFSHSKKDLSFKLSIPNGAATKKYFVLKAEFKPKSCSLWGKLQWGVAVWADSELIYDIHPDVILYRAYVFDDEMWRKYEDIGVPVGGIWHYHGEDKKW